MKSRGRKLPFSPAEIYSLVSVIPSANSTGQQRTGHDSADDAQADSHAETNQSPLAAGLGLDGRTVLPRQEQNQADQRDKEAQKRSGRQKACPPRHSCSPRRSRRKDRQQRYQRPLCHNYYSISFPFLSFRGGVLPYCYICKSRGRRHKVCAPCIHFRVYSPHDELLTRRHTPSCGRT